MNSEVLKRYDMTVDNKFIISVSIPNYKAIFQNYDFTASFYKRDLNENLVAHIFECVEEIGPQNDFLIRFDLPVNQKSASEENDILFSFRSYFDYLMTLCRKETKTAFGRLVIHFGIAGIAFLGWLLIIAGFSDNESAFYQFCTIGLSVGIWVLLLTGISRFLYRIKSQFAEMKMCNKITSSVVEFNYN